MAKLTKIIAITLVAVIAVSVLASGGSGIVGTWIGEEDGEGYEVTFTKDGEITMNVDGIEVYSGNYTVDESNRVITVTYQYRFFGSTVTKEEEWKYERKGNTLKLTISDYDSAIELKKK